MAFTLDTSGEIEIPHGPVLEGNLRRHKAMCWSDLTPFAQGYVEAASRELQDRLDREGMADPDGPEGPVRFSWWSPEALAMILGDCERFSGDRAQGGAAFWRGRQNGVSTLFPPLTPYLGDDGKIYLRAA